MSVLWRQGSTFQYAASIAATWVWAPAIFVASSMAYTSGIYGFLWFLIPNVLTLLLFGYISSKIDTDGWNIGHVVSKAGLLQVWTHKWVSTILLMCSTVVQFIGIYTLVHGLFGFDKDITAIGISVIALAMVWFGGIKACIITDGFKYAIMVIVGIILACLCINNGTLNMWGNAAPSFLDVTTNFGIISAIGLLSAPYADQTFWQRAYSIPKEKRFLTFSLAGAMFLIVPLLFGICGFMNGNQTDWTLANAFDGYTKYILFAGVLCALISTIDSNLCAFSSLYIDDLDDTYTHFVEKFFMLLLVCVSSIIFISTELTIVQLFLLYGTIRTCIAMPTIMTIFNRYSEYLPYTTIGTVIGCSFGYAYMSYYLNPYAWVMTVLALITPLLLAYEPKKMEV